ncbi:MAG: alpha-amylase/4-alpha-glucanotransferase domain-containing protein [Sphaerochaetaceae bacterium]
MAHVYKPLLTHLYNNTELKFHLYLPAAVLEWFEQAHPEMNMLIADLVKKEQLELLGGSYHHAVLQLLPNRERSLQLEMSTTLLRKRYGKRPKNIWFFNQIWNPSYALNMRGSLFERLIISPYNRLHNVNGNLEPFRMQEMGTTIEVFPTDILVEDLVYHLSLGKLKPQEALTQLEKYTPKAMVMINVDQLLMMQGMLDESVLASEVLLSILENFTSQESQLLGSLPFGAVTNSGYLSSGWYGKDTSLNDFSSFNEIFIRHGELNHLYGRVLHLVELSRVYRKNKDTKKRVEALLSKAMSGGSFALDASGGYYRHHYRKHLYRLLLEAQKQLSQAEPISFPLEYDIDFDCNKEIIWQGKHIGAVLDSKGGSVVELSYIPTFWNYCDSFGCDASEAKPLGLCVQKDGLIHRSFVDLLLPHDADLHLDALKTASQGNRLIYQMNPDERIPHEIEATAQFSNLGHGLGTLSITKRYRLKMNTVVIDYTLTNSGKHKSRGFIGSVLNLSIGMKEGEDIELFTVEKNRNRMLALTEDAAYNLKNFRINDTVNRTILSFASDERFSLAKADLCVKAPTIMGMEELYQHTRLVPLWNFELAPNSSYQWTIGFRIERKVGVMPSGGKRS